MTINNDSPQGEREDSPQEEREYTEQENLNIFNPTVICLLPDLGPSMGLRTKEAIMQECTFQMAILKFQRQNGYSCAHCFGTRVTPYNVMFNHGFLHYLEGCLSEEQDDMMWKLIGWDVERPYVGDIICEECLTSIVKKIHPYGEYLVEAEWERDEHGWCFAPLPDFAKHCG